jgi:hypothetical protein
VTDYQRDQPTLPRTLAYYQFKRDFTTVNDYYWGTGSALQAVSGRVRHMGATDDFHTDLGLTQAAYAQPLGHTAQIYSKKLTVSKRWHRLLTLVIMISAFERYLSAVATLAIASDPALTAGFPKRIDGLTLAKYELNTGDRPTEPLTKGEWSARLAAFGKYFGEVPARLRASEGELEIMRTTRNRVAHEFGLNVPAMSAHAALLLGARRPGAAVINEVSISEETVKKWLAKIDISAAAIDGYLLPNFIGGYELAAIYIEWNRDGDAFYQSSGVKPYRRGSKAKQFSKLLGALLDHPVQYETAQSIMDYVDQL